MSRKPYYTNMPNDEYWKYRAKEQLQDAVSDAEYVDKKVSKLYKKCLSDFSKEYKDLLEPYRINGVYDYDKIKVAMQYDLTFNYKMNRLQKEIMLFSDELSKKELNYVTDLLCNVYDSTFTNNLKGLGVKGMEKLNKNAILESIKMPYTADGKEFSDRIWKNKTNMTKHLKTALSESIAKGQPIDKTSKQFRDIMGTSLSNSKRIIRTETIAIYNKASVESYKQAGVEYLEVLDTEDSRTCNVCQEHDGEKVLLTEATVGVNIPVFHPNCRCCVIPVVK